MIEKIIPLKWWVTPTADNDNDAPQPSWEIEALGAFIDVRSEYPDVFFFISAQKNPSEYIAEIARGLDCKIGEISFILITWENHHVLPITFVTAIERRVPLHLMDSD